MLVFWNALYPVNVYQVIINDRVAIHDVTERGLQPSIALRASNRILAWPLLQRALDHRVNRMIVIILDRNCLRACRRKRSGSAVRCHVHRRRVDDLRGGIAGAANRQQTQERENRHRAEKEIRDHDVPSKFVLLSRDFPDCELLRPISPFGASSAFVAASATSTRSPRRRD